MEKVDNYPIVLFDLSKENIELLKAKYGFDYEFEDLIKNSVASYTEQEATFIQYKDVKDDPNMAKLCEKYPLVLEKKLRRPLIEKYADAIIDLYKSDEFKKQNAKKVGTQDYVVFINGEPQLSNIELKDIYDWKVRIRLDETSRDYGVAYISNPHYMEIPDFYNETLIKEIPAIKKMEKDYLFKVIYHDSLNEDSKYVYIDGKKVLVNENKRKAHIC